ncbi:MAG: hypothetical protein HUU25_13945 [Candidatus Sumerlaeia bacterium]|nr:hypothetical protein [Candidatus Sumerlaeia bacterium]
MLRPAFCFSLAAIAALSVSAQDLDTTYVSDEFTSGSRGNALGTGPTFNNSLTDGTEFLAITNTDGVTGTINYINIFAGATGGEVESPVYNVTVAQDNQDRTLPGAIEAIVASGGADPGAVLVGDDGGTNGLLFGENDDANYFVEAAVYCYNRTTPGPPGYETHSVMFRGARDGEGLLSGGGGSYTMDRVAGSFAITWDAQLGTVFARRWNGSTTTADITNRVATTFTDFGSTTLAEGWHTFRIEGYGSVITFTVDGSELASVIDSTFPNGRAGLIYREASVVSADETQAYFDNMRAGPATPPTVTSVEQFELYR